MKAPEDVEMMDRVELVARDGRTYDALACGSQVDRRGNVGLKLRFVGRGPGGDAGAAERYWPHSPAPQPGHWSFPQ